MPGIEGPRPHYDPRMFDGISPNVMRDLKVRKDETKGISEKVFKQIAELKKNNHLTGAHLAAARQILTGSHDAKAETLFYKVFGRITGSEGRFETRMQELDKIEYSTVKNELKRMKPDKATAEAVLEFQGKVREQLFGAGQNLKLKLTDKEKDRMYSEISRDVLIQGVRQGWLTKELTDRTHPLFASLSKDDITDIQRYIQPQRGFDLR